MKIHCLSTIGLVCRWFANKFGVSKIFGCQGHWFPGVWVFLFFCFSPQKASSQVLESDSLALVALYNATDGDNWTNNTNWLTGDVSPWHGISVGEGRVNGLGFSNYNFTGPLPTEIG